MDFLFTLLRLSLLGSLLALLLLLLRPVLVRLAGRTVYYYLWLAVLLRLCLPFGVTLPLPALPADAGTAPPDSAAVSPFVPPVTVTPAAPTVGEPVLSPPPAVTSAPEAPVRTAPALSLPALLTALWAAGVAVSWGWYAHGYRRFAKKVRRSALPPSPAVRAVLERLDPAGRTGLIVSPAAGSPMLIGAIRPTVVLPPDVPEDRLEDILAHELTHARRHDLLFKWFAAVVSGLHWFDPIMFLVRREIGRACELSCDQAVIRTMDPAARRHYGETLLALAATPSPGPGLLTATLCEEGTQLKERLISIVKEQKRGMFPFLLGLLLAASLCSCALVNAAKPIAKEDASDPIQAPGASMGGIAPDQAPAPASTPDSTAFPGVTDPELQKVLLGEAQLTCLLGDVSQTVSIQDVPTLFDPDSQIGQFFWYGSEDGVAYAQGPRISQYAVIDLDGDGQEEVVLQVIAPAGDMGGFLILHREDSTVWGYLYSYRSLTYLKTDGSFRGSSSLGESWWTATVRFNGGVLVTDQHLFASTPDHSENFVYEIDGQPATKEAFDAGMAEQGHKPDALWYDFASANAPLTGAPVMAVVSAGSEQHTNDGWNEKAAAAYAEVLQDILIDGALPDGSEYPSSAAYDTFALCDVDGDGHDELIVYCISTITAGHRGFVLSYDAASDSVQERFSGYPSLHFYENGAIREDWSHSQGWAGDSFWPYHLWSLDRETGAYVERGAVDAWDRSVNENGFPQDVDADGDGMLYQLFLTEEDWYHYQSPSAYVDGAEYARWRDEYLEGSAELFVDFTPLTAEYIRLLKSGGWYDVKG